MKRYIIQLAMLFILSATSHAYYQSDQGRWLNRDPIGEWGGVALYAFAGNSPLQHIDARGLFFASGNSVPDSATSPLPCCDGESYDGSSHCCCLDGKMGNGTGAKIVSRAKETTEITTYKWTGESDGNGIPVHYWIAWAGGSADANASSLLGSGLGDRMVRFPAAGKIYTDNTEATTVMLSPCKYDFKKLNNCLSNKIKDMVGEPSGYGGKRACEAFVFGFLNECKNESTGCTMP